MISILGCGWLGLPLAKSFINDGFSVKGSTTTKEKLHMLSDEGIESYFFHLSDHKNVMSYFLNNPVLIINIPPGQNKDEYIFSLNHLNAQIEKCAVKNVVFISSTSVYIGENRQIDEDSNVETTGQENKLFLAEEIFRKNKGISSTIIRMGGLFGKKRHPGRFFAGKTAIPNGLNHVNLIHLDDCIGIIKKVVYENYWNQTINACAPNHPTRIDFYTEATRVYGGIIPEFLSERKNDKIISSQKLITALGYQFIHPNLITALDSLTEE